MSLAVNIALLDALTIALLARGSFDSSVHADALRSRVAGDKVASAATRAILRNRLQAADLRRSADKLNCRAMDAKRSRHSHLPKTSCTFCRQLSSSTVVGS